MEGNVGIGNSIDNSLSAFSPRVEKWGSNQKGEKSKRAFFNVGEVSAFLY